MTDVRPRLGRLARCRPASRQLASVPAARTQDGAVALETALVAPLVALVVAGVLSVTVVAIDQLTAERVARTAARSIAVSGHVGDAASVLPVGGDLTVERSSRSATVVVTVTGAVAGVPYDVRATATAVLEPALP